MGSLFMQNMKTKEVIGDESFCRVLRYIHNNPVHHGFVKNIEDWPYSSYNLFLNNEESIIKKDPALEIFGGMDNFIKFHKEPMDSNEDYLEQI